MRVFDYDKLKDPQYFCDGRIAAHSDHKYFASKEDAEETACGKNGYDNSETY